MKAKPIPKFSPENKKNNIVIELTALDADKNKYKCVGVLMKENEKTFRIGFNAMNNTVVDYLDIKTKQIIDIKLIKPKEIEKIK